MRRNYSNCNSTKPPKNCIRLYPQSVNCSISLGLKVTQMICGLNDLLLHPSPLSKYKIVHLGAYIIYYATIKICVIKELKFKIRFLSISIW